MPPSMKMYRCSTAAVLLCLMLSISGPLAGNPPVICINTSSFSLNAATRSIQSATASRLDPNTVLYRVNRFLTAPFCMIRSNNYVYLATGNLLR
ncbi:hypothetical protein DIS24_g12101 [Lasiodiplodia hormozganensis]|uniref:Secreted protein n=1 Tax=Lasiodiplodia hormozganensis TaxID=869390 RepID=A0AA39WBN3_9PEZI|nr:hypothetical protein DIS24_g12101 [Lasiodiplodia hormozganensis]